MTSATNRVGRPTVTGGTTACVVAARLAAADATLRVLLLEAGPTTYNDPSHTEPLKYLSHIAPDSRTARFHVTQPSAALGGRTLTVPSGQCLGGGGSINCAPHVSCPLYELRPSDLALGEFLAVMMYARPSASDYDDWETVYGNPGWGSKDLIPLLKKVCVRAVLGLKLRGRRSRRIRFLVGAPLTARTVPSESHLVVLSRTSGSSPFKLRGHSIQTVLRNRMTQIRMI